MFLIIKIIYKYIYDLFKTEKFRKLLLRFVSESNFKLYKKPNENFHEYSFINKNFIAFLTLRTRKNALNNIQITFIHYKFSNVFSTSIQIKDFSYTFCTCTNRDLLVNVLLGYS